MPRFNQFDLDQVWQRFDFVLCINYVPEAHRANVSVWWVCFFVSPLSKAAPRSWLKRFGQRLSYNQILRQQQRRRHCHKRQRSLDRHDAGHGRGVSAHGAGEGVGAGRGW